MRYLLGVDVGSSDCKVVLLDERGSLISSAAAAYPTFHPRPNWAEQNAEDWYGAARAAIRTCLNTADIDPRAIAGICVDGPAHNVALLDQHFQPIYPVIHWSDLRSVPQTRFLEEQAGERIFQLSLCRVNAAWTLAQLLWLRQNEPEVWSKLRHLLVTKDYVRYRLTGDYQTDPYDAIGTQLYDAYGQQWSAELCALTDLNPAWLPAVCPPTAIAGTLIATAAADLGLPAGIPVAVGSGDSVVEALGIGAVAAGQGLVKIGTAANVNLVTAQPQPSRQSITYPHVVADQWFTITATNSGASTMRWFRDTFCRLEVQQAAAQGISVYALIDQLAEGSAPGAQGLIFHPYLNGERTPYWDPDLRGDFVGITAQHNIHHFARAILEGVAFSLRDCVDAVRQIGQPISELYLVGGGAKSARWAQTICDVIGQPLIKPPVEDAAFGAALLAGIAVGVFADTSAAVDQGVRTGTILQPNPALRDLYDAYFEVYRAITRDLAQHHHQLTKLVANYQPSKVENLHEDTNTQAS
ncbi:MAG: xylulokinase [Anaerolineae bacterium]